MNNSAPCDGNRHPTGRRSIAQTTSAMSALRDDGHERMFRTAKWSRVDSARCLAPNLRVKCRRGGDAEVRASAERGWRTSGTDPDAGSLRVMRAIGGRRGLQSGKVNEFDGSER